VRGEASASSSAASHFAVYHTTKGGDENAKTFNRQAEGPRGIPLAQHHISPARSKGSNRSSRSTPRGGSKRYRLTGSKFNVQCSMAKLQPKAQGKTNSAGHTET